MSSLFLILQGSVGGGGRAAGALRAWPGISGRSTTHAASRDSGKRSTRAVLRSSFSRKIDGVGVEDDVVRRAEVLVVGEPHCGRGRGHVLHRLGRDLRLVSFADRCPAYMITAASNIRSSWRPGAAQNRALAASTDPPRGAVPPVCAPWRSSRECTRRALKPHNRLSLVLSRRLDIWMRFVFRTLGCEKAQGGQQSACASAVGSAAAWSERAARSASGRNRPTSAHAHHVAWANRRGGPGPAARFALARSAEPCFRPVRLYFPGAWPRVALPRYLANRGLTGFPAVPLASFPFNLPHARASWTSTKAVLFAWTLRLLRKKGSGARAVRHSRDPR